MSLCILAAADQKVGKPAASIHAELLSLLARTPRPVEYRAPRTLYGLFLQLLSVCVSKPPPHFRNPARQKAAPRSSGPSELSEPSISSDIARIAGLLERLVQEQQESREEGRQLRLRIATLEAEVEGRRTGETVPQDRDGLMARLVQEQQESREEGRQLRLRIATLEAEIEGRRTGETVPQDRDELIAQVEEVKDLVKQMKHSLIAIDESLTCHFELAAQTEDTNSSTSVHRACWFGNIAVIKTLAKFPGIDFNYCNNSFGESPLATAIKAGHLDIAEYLLDLEGTNVNARINDLGKFDTALIAAVCAGEKTLVERLLSVPGIELNARGKEGITALALAEEAVKEYRGRHDVTNPDSVHHTKYTELGAIAALLSSSQANRNT